MDIIRNYRKWVHHQDTRYPSLLHAKRSLHEIVIRPTTAKVQAIVSKQKDKTDGDKKYNNIIMGRDSL